MKGGSTAANGPSGDYGNSFYSGNGLPDPRQPGGQQHWWHMP